jgi:dTDP-glucose 4,6-dehydratase
MTIQPEQQTRLLVTGGAGFIGSSLVRRALALGSYAVCTFDKLTYAADRDFVAELANHPDHWFVHGDICDPALVAQAIASFRPDAVMHLAAESHVDRSIDGPAAFVQTNVVGTQVMLDAALSYWRELPDQERTSFRFHHISTDEVFGSVEEPGRFHPDTPYDPSSPYSASKAASDLLVRAWNRTYGLPIVLSNCSNNYGPRQFPEKLIPLMIIKALREEALPVYGDGGNVRDWLHVEDHVDALLAVLMRGRVGATYLIGGGTEMTNLDLVERICDLLDAKVPSANGARRRLISFVEDRPGHDRRYAIDASATERELGWRPARVFDVSLAELVGWYLDQQDWWEAILAERYDAKRLGRAA